MEHLTLSPISFFRYVPCSNHLTTKALSKGSLHATTYYLWCSSCVAEASNALEYGLTEGCNWRQATYFSAKETHRSPSSNILYNTALYSTKSIIYIYSSID